jgi:hypothetical protein
VLQSRNGTVVDPTDSSWNLLLRELSELSKIAEQAPVAAAESPAVLQPQNGGKHGRFANPRGSLVFLTTRVSRTNSLLIG